MALEAHWHAMIAVIRNKFYRCARCGYEGDLERAVAHAVANQERA
jgi:hypothetical protein